MSDPDFFDFMMESGDELLNKERMLCIRCN